MGALRDKILEQHELPKEQVQTDEWGPLGVPFVYVRGLTAKEREEWELAQTVRGSNGGRVPNPKPKPLIRAGFVVKIVVDENGEREFEDKDAEMLANEAASLVERLWNVGRRLSGIFDEDEVEANPSTDDQDENS